MTLRVDRKADEPLGDLGGSEALGAGREDLGASQGDGVGEDEAGPQGGPHRIGQRSDEEGWLRPANDDESPDISREYRRVRTRVVRRSRLPTLMLGRSRRRGLMRVGGRLE